MPLLLLQLPGTSAALTQELLAKASQPEAAPEDPPRAQPSPLQPFGAAAAAAPGSLGPLGELLLGQWQAEMAAAQQEGSL